MVGDVHAEARARRRRFPDRDRLPLAFRVDRSGVAVIDHPPCRAVGRLVGEDPVHGGGALQAGSSVDDVPGGHGLPLGGARSKGDENLSRRDADAQLESLIEREVADRERCTNSTLRIVVVSRRSAEESHYRVSDELLHRAAVALQVRAHSLVVRAEDRPHVLRVELLGLRSEADEVAEEHGDDLALLTREPRVGGEPRAHIPHSRKPSGFSWPQLGQVITRRDYGVGRVSQHRGRYAMHVRACGNVA